MLFLKEEEVRKLLTMDAAIKALREAFTFQALGKVRLLPRFRLSDSDGTLSQMGCTILPYRMSGIKTYYAGRKGISFVVVLFSTEKAETLAVMEASTLGQIRTGAASAVVTDKLSKSDAETAVCFGAGYQAETQIEGLCAVRHVRDFYIKASSERSAEEFCGKMKDRISAELHVLRDRKKLKEADIIIAATTAREPVLWEAEINGSCHINAIGANRIEFIEMDGRIVGSARTVVVDSKAQAVKESGDIMQAVAEGLIEMDDVNEISQLFSGSISVNRKAVTDRTLFKSMGIALEDVAVAKVIYEGALKEGAGITL